MTEEGLFITRRKQNKLMLDSEEQERKEAEQRARQEQYRRRKEEKRLRKEAEAKKAEEQAAKQRELAEKYQNPNTMLLEDSDSHDSFSRVAKKIRKMYPEIRHKEQQRRREASQSDSEEDSDQSDEDSSSDQESSTPRPKKKAKREQKERKERPKHRHHQQDSEQARARRAQRVRERVKEEEYDPKEKLVRELSVRWWYSLPEWPPSDFEYEPILNKNGYRLVDPARFRVETDLVNGLYKAAQIDGYPGFFKTKTKLLDLRPKDKAPSMNYLRSFSMQDLTDLLRRAIRAQIGEITNQDYEIKHRSEVIRTLNLKLRELK